MALVTSEASAATITLTVGAGGNPSSDHILGEIFTRNDLQGGGCGQDCADAAAINDLLALSAGTRSGTDPEYYRAANTGVVLPAATATNAVDTGNASTITLSQVFKWLVVGYDGTNGGSQAYYIGNLAVGDVLQLVPNARPDGVAKNADCGGVAQPSCGNLVADDFYGITHSTLLNPSGLTPSPTPFGSPVPDGGMTISLLGMAMTGMALIARRAKK